MATSNYALRIPPTLMAEIKAWAERDASSVNQFIVVAVAEKIAALRERRYFAERAARADPATFDRILNKAGGEPPRESDEIPDGCLDERPADDQVTVVPAKTR